MYLDFTLTDKTLTTGILPYLAKMCPIIGPTWCNLEERKQRDEMVDILIHLHHQIYIPSIEFKKNITVGTRELFEMKGAVLWKVS